MKRNSSAPDESNLELLLDTICNTFGVVLFITLLVVIRVNALQAEVETQAPDEESELELVEQQQELDEAQSRLKELKEAFKQQKSVAERYSTTESRVLASKVQEPASELVDQLNRKQQSLSDIVRTQQAINQTASDLEEQAETVERLRQEAAEIESQLKTEVTQRSRSSRTPELRPSQRQPIAIFLKNGRLCRLLTPLGNNLSQSGKKIAKTTDATGNVVYEAVSGAGLAISTDPPNTAAVKAALAGYIPQDHVLQVFFWGDSFAECQLLRDVMVDMNFRYALIPLPDGQTIGAQDSAQTIYEQ